MEMSELIVNYVKAITKVSDSIEVMVVGNLMIVNVDNTSLSIIELDYDTGYIMSSDYELFKHSIDPFVYATMCFPMGAPMSNLDKKILGYYHNYMEIIKRSPVVAECEALRDIEDYETLLSMKADDGAKFFRVIGNDPNEVFFVPVFTGFPNVNKADKVGIVIYRIDEDTLLCEYHIYKKKINKTITQYFRILDLGRR